MSTFRALFLGLILLACSALGQAFEFTLVKGDPAMLHHWPDDDALIGTADDLIRELPSEVHGSETNIDGRYSYNAFDFGWMPGDEGIPPGGYEAITFLEGTVGVDMNIAENGGGPLFYQMDISGTAPFDGHAPYSSSFVQVNGGSYDPVSKAFTLNVDLQAEIGGTPDQSLDFDVSGDAWVIVAADFGTATGVSYLDDVVIPRAMAQGASRLVFIQMTGVVPAAEGFSWGTMPLIASLVAFTDATATGQTSWSQIKANF